MPHQVEECRRNGQARHQRLAVDDTINGVQAHRVQCFGRGLQVALDLGLAELVVAPLVPVALAIEGVEGKALLLGSGAPAWALCELDLAHAYPPKKLPDLPPQPLRAVAWLPNPPREMDAETAERDAVRPEAP
ncbi:hypothetical protein D3C80_1217040 [compost metagenome]